MTTAYSKDSQKNKLQRAVIYHNESYGGSGYRAGHERREKFTMDACLVYQEWARMSRLRGEIENVEMVNRFTQIWVNSLPCILLSHTPLLPLRIMPLVSLLSQLKGPRLACIARACLISHSIYLETLCSLSCCLLHLWWVSAGLWGAHTRFYIVSLVTECW